MTKLEALRELVDQVEPYVDFEFQDNFNPHNRFGGNMDDAFWGGFEQGEKSLASVVRGILEDEECS